MQQQGRRDWFVWGKGLLFVLCSGPALWLLVRALNNSLGPDPAKALVDQAGLWALRCLLLCLAMTPLRRLTGMAGWIRYRRPLGLFALFYAALHVLAYVLLLFAARWAALAEELVKRPYILVGLLAFLPLLALGLTSTRAMQRRLQQRWVRLHRLIYPLTVLVLLHFAWSQKLGIYAIWPYAVLALLLLGLRLWWFFQRSTGKAENGR